MCVPISFWVRRNGEIVQHELSDSHEDIRELYDIPDNVRGMVANVIKCEYTPSDGVSFAEPDQYQLRVDEQETPLWFNAAMRDRVTTEMDEYVRSIIIRDRRKILLGGRWIIADGAEIGRVVNANIAAICGGTVATIYSGTVGEMRGGTVEAINGGTVGEMRGGTVEAIWGGTVEAIRGGIVGTIWGGTVVNDYRKNKTPVEA